MTGYSTGPAWKRMRDDLRAEIERGDYAPGDPVPSEVKLAEAYGVTRMTSRHALVELVTEGVLDAGQGRARTVSRHRALIFDLARRADWAAEGEAPTTGADSWLGAAERAGYQPTQRIAVMTQEAGPDLARRLEIPERGVVIARQVTRFTGRDPDNQVTFWSPQDVAEGTPLAHPASITEGSVAWLESKHGRLRQVIEAFPRPPTPAEAEQLRIPPGTWVQIVWRVLRTKDRPLMASMGAYQRAVLRIEL